MLRIVDAETGELRSLTDVLDIDADSYLSIDDLLQRLMDEQAAGTIRIEPLGEALQRQHVRTELLSFTMRTKLDDGVRQFAPDRRGGRINRAAYRLQELDDIHRRETMRSIERFMMIEGPAAYRSQAAFMATLDPTVDAATIARGAATRVSEAVQEGIALGKAISRTHDQTDGQPASIPDEQAV